jgi:polyhydroxybutyrate depolymerase
MTRRPRFWSRFGRLSRPRRDRNGWAAVLLAVLVLVTAACDRPAKEAAPARTTTTTATAAPATCEGRPVATPGDSEATIRVGDVDRTYLLHVPASYDATKPTPVVFNFHGHGSSAAVQMAYGDFRPLAEREGFLVVAPNGQGTPRHFTLLGALAGEADDVEVATTLLDHLEDELCIDEDRVFSTGMSNGGALSSVIACRAADRFAAVGAVAAMIFVPPCADPAPIVGMMGDADPIVPYAGGRVTCCGNPTIPAVADTFAKFARASGCDETPDEQKPATSIQHRVWTGCDDTKAVELYTIEGGGHTWPGSPVDTAARGLGATTKELVATETLWAFFKAHPRSRT